MDETSLREASLSLDNLHRTAFALPAGAESIPVAELVTEAVELVALAKMIGPITDAMDRELKGHLWVRAKAFDRKIEAMVAPTKEAYHRQHAAVCASERAFRAPLKAFIDTIGSDMRAWDDARERERKAKEEALSRQLREDEERRRLDRAVDLEKAGRKEEAGKLIAAPVPDQRVVLESEAQKVAGQASVEKWTFEIEDAAKVPREYLVVDESKIRGVVNALKDQARIPGVRVFSTTNYRATGRKP